MKIHTRPITIVHGPSRPLATPKPIEFKSVMVGERFLKVIHERPSHFKFIELICKNYRNVHMDLMLAYNDPHERNTGMFITGHWNGGIAK